MERLTITRCPAAPRGFADSDRLFLRPVGQLRGEAALRATESGSALPLAGGPIAFSACEIIVRNGDEATAAWLSVDTLAAWRGGLPVSDGKKLDAVLDHIVAPRMPFAGLAMDGPRLMGIVNVTPDSFSDGGQFTNADDAIAFGRALADAGADLIDVGGESTRPGAGPTSLETEQERVLPVVEGLAKAGQIVSIDTRNPETMTLAAAAGAQVVNDVTALTHDAQSLPTAAKLGLPVVLMHSAGDPRTMQNDPVYDHAALDIYEALADRIAACIDAGVPRNRIAIDPGFGFGKSPQHNVRLVAWAAMFHGLGCPIVMGASRKSTIARLGGPSAQDSANRLPGSLTLAQAAWDQGVQIVRVHDVAETAQARAIWQRLGEA